LNNPNQHNQRQTRCKVYDQQCQMDDEILQLENCSNLGRDVGKNLFPLRVRLFVPIKEKSQNPQNWFIVTLVPPTAQEAYVPHWMLGIMETLYLTCQSKPEVPRLIPEETILLLYYPKREYTDEKGKTFEKPEQIGMVEFVLLDTKGQPTALYAPLHLPEIEEQIGESLATEHIADQIYSFVDEDGTRYHWNTTIGNQIAEQSGRETDLFCPSDQGVDLAHIRKRYPEINEDYAMTTDITKPLLFVPFKGKMQLVDGWHRLLKAVTLGVLEVSAHVLTQEEADSVLLETWDTEEARSCGT
jgi:hypothetical protein